MKLLLVNDDGWQHEGIQTLARVLSEKHEVVLCAPMGERSASSQSINVRSPLLVQKVTAHDLPCTVYYVDGSPADCTRMALTEICPDADLVVTGINAGYNVSVDTRYSGTVGCAMEALLQGKPALAVSAGGHPPYLYLPAARIAEKVVSMHLAEKMPAGIMLSLNVPSIPENEIQGIRVAPLHMDTLSPIGHHLSVSENENRNWYLTRFNHPFTEEGDVDTAYLSKGYAIITPLSMDMTAYGALDELKSALLQFE